MALNTLDGKIKRLKSMGGTIAPKTADILTHLVEQSREQAVEGVLAAHDYERLKADLKRLQNDNRLFFFCVFFCWLAVIFVFGAAVYYG